MYVVCIIVISKKVKNVLIWLRLNQFCYMIPGQCVKTKVPGMIVLFVLLFKCRLSIRKVYRSWVRGSYLADIILHLRKVRGIQRIFRVIQVLGSFSFLSTLFCSKSRFGDFNRQPNAVWLYIYRMPKGL